MGKNFLISFQQHKTKHIYKARLGMNTHIHGKNVVFSGPIEEPSSGVLPVFYHPC